MGLVSVPGAGVSVYVPNKYVVVADAMRGADAMSRAKWTLGVVNTLAVCFLAVGVGTSTESGVLAIIAFISGILGVLLLMTVLGWFEHMLRVNAMMLAELPANRPQSSTSTPAGG
jgi:hypothetical protein